VISSGVFERTPTLPGDWSAAGQASGHGVDGGPADHGFGVRGEAFVVAGESSVGGYPGQGAFHRPSAGHAEAFLVWRFADDVHDDAQDASGPFDQAAGEACVGEDEPAANGGQVCTEQRALLAPSRSWTLAAHTITVISEPIVSVTMNILRPLTFLPAA
jgi:hypothetical protein